MNRLAAFAVLSSFAAVPALAEDPAPTPVTQPAAGPALDFRKLKELLPDTLAGLKRTEASGERNSLGEITIATARASYGEGDKTITLEISDFGANSSMAAVFQTMSTMQIDSETDDGYEKSIKVAGQPGLEEFHASGETKNGKFTFYINARMSLQLNSERLTKEEFKKIVDQLPIAKLAELK